MQNWKISKNQKSFNFFFVVGRERLKHFLANPPNITPPRVLYLDVENGSPGGGGVIFGRALSAPIYFLLKMGVLYLGGVILGGLI